MCVTDRHDMTLAVKVALNPSKTNQPIKQLLIFLVVKTRDFSLNRNIMMLLSKIPLKLLQPSVGTRMRCSCLSTSLFLKTHLSLYLPLEKKVLPHRYANRPLGTILTNLSLDISLVRQNATLCGIG